MSTDRKRPRGCHYLSSRALERRIDFQNRGVHGNNEPAAEEEESEFPELNSVRYKGSDFPEDERPVRETKRTVRPAYWKDRG